MQRLCSKAGGVGGHPRFSLRRPAHFGGVHLRPQSRSNLSCAYVAACVDAEVGAYVDAYVDACVNIEVDAYVDVERSILEAQDGDCGSMRMK